MSLFVGGKDRHAIGSARIDPLLSRLYQLLLARRNDMEFPIPAAHAHHAVCQHTEDRFVLASCFRRQDREKVFPIDRTVGGYRNASCFQRGWKQIHHDRRRIADMASRDPTWPARNQGNPQTPFPVVALHASQSTGAPSIPWTVITGENDQSLVIEP